MCKYDTIKDVKKDIFWYIEIFYNRKRSHSTLQYMTPVEYLRKHEVLKTA
ncbi:MAG: IS3 family transposase [Erysipelotrichaceae bacterium]|nr:IS3 family transposase [Erysipelotrichaceae bacterium]